jgi:hypothetical protein
LKIYLKRVSYFGDDPKVHIKIKDLKALTQSGASKAILNSNDFEFASLNCNISGASNFFTENLLVNTLGLNLSGASDFICSELISQNFNITCNGASNIKLSQGNCERLKLNLSGASDFRDFGFVSQYADLDLSGASNAKLTIEKELNIKATGASNCQYRGNCVIKNINLSGASTCKRN